MRVLLACFLILWPTSVVLAHSWYSQKKDPVYQDSCCGGMDCAMWAIQPGEIEAVEEGYRVRISLERSKTFNPYSQHPIDAIVTWDRVQPSEDGNWHLCIMQFSRTQPRGGIYCLFAPPNI